MILQHLKSLAEMPGMASKQILTTYKIIGPIFKQKSVKVCRILQHTNCKLDVINGNITLIGVTNRCLNKHLEVESSVYLLKGPALDCILHQFKGTMMLKEGPGVPAMATCLASFYLNT